MTAPTAPVLPLWTREPAKIVGWIVSAVLAAAAGITVLVAQFSDLIPDKYRATVQTVVGICATVTVVGNRVQTWMTRNGIGPTGNGKDGVVSPATFEAAVGSAHAQGLASGLAANGDGSSLPGAPGA